MTGLWCALLWFCAPIFTPRDREIDVASRLRDMLILGVAIPGVLAFAGVLYWWSTIAAGCVLAGLRIARRPPLSWSFATMRSRDPFSWRALPVLGVLASTWPALVRPVLDGDSLSYHLPNAGAWVHAHGLWVTNTRYWWYPGGSELFAAGTFAVAGPYGLPVCGALAMLLLGQRFYAFGIRASVPSIMAAATSTLLVTAHAFALQAGNLENDVWLSAFLLEILWCLRYERDALVRTAFVGALVKPIGFAFVAGLCAIARAPIRAAAIASLGLIVWALRDAVLSPGASIPISASAYAHPELTTIAAHGFVGIATLFRATLADGFGLSLLALALAITLIARTDRVVKFCAALFTVLFLIEPFGFNNSVPQLASGHALRYFLPAIVFGALGMLPLLRRINAWYAVIPLAVAVEEVYRFEKIFAADSSTNGTLAFVAIAAVVFLVPNAHMRLAGSGVLALGLIAYGGRVAGIHPAGYYDDELTASGVTSAPFAWLHEARPARVVAWSFRSGAIDVLTPDTEVIESFDEDACATARAAKVLLVTIDDGTAFPNARNIARACGHVVFESPAALIVQP